MFNVFRTFCLASLRPHSPLFFCFSCPGFFLILFFFFSGSSSLLHFNQFSSDLLQKLIPKMADDVEEAHLASRAAVLIFSVISICSGLFFLSFQKGRTTSSFTDLFFFFFFFFFFCKAQQQQLPQQDVVLELTKSFLVALCRHTTAAFASMTGRLFNLSLSEISDNVLRVTPLLAASSASSLNSFRVAEYFDELVVVSFIFVIRIRCFISSLFFFSLIFSRHLSQNRKK